MFKKIKEVFIKAKVGSKEVQLNLCYTDKAGNKFYEPTNISDYPYIRVNWIYTYSRYADLKLTPERLMLLISAIKEANNNGDRDTIALMCNEIDVAEQLFCEKTTLENLAASMFLINDEPVNSWNESYQAQKVLAMKNDADCMAFFLPKAYAILQSYKDNSQLQVVEYLQKTTVIIDRLLHLLRATSTKRP